MSIYKTLVTTSKGVRPTLTRELKFHRLKPYNAFDTGTYCDMTLEQIAHCNVRLRTALKVRIIGGIKEKVTDFDKLFAAVQTVDRSQYRYADQDITVTVRTDKHSALQSGPSIQSIAHRAILDCPAPAHDNPATLDPLDVRLLLNENAVTILINTSGPSLHKRGRRIDEGEAMIKEHIAAALVLMTSRGYSDPLIDPCCGSGTIPIEAAMIASNRAPGLLRSFACEEFPDPQRAKAVQDVVDTAKTKIFEKDYIILGYDIQQELIDQAKTNAESAGVSKLVKFAQNDITGSVPGMTGQTTIVANPPYGLRIGHAEAGDVHEALIDIALQVNATTVVSGWEFRNDAFKKRQRRRQYLNNGGEECEIYLSN